MRAPKPAAPMMPSRCPCSLRVGVYFVLFSCRSASAPTRCCSTGRTSWEILRPSNSVSDGWRRTTAVSCPWILMYTRFGAALNSTTIPIVASASRPDASTRASPHEEVDDREHGDEHQREAA